MVDENIKMENSFEDFTQYLESISEISADFEPKFIEYESCILSELKRLKYSIDKKRHIQAVRFILENDSDKLIHDLVEAAKCDGWALTDIPAPAIWYRFIPDYKLLSSIEDVLVRLDPDKSFMIEIIAEFLACGSGKKGAIYRNTTTYTT